MAHSNRPDPLATQRGGAGPLQSQSEGSRSLQLDMFGAPPQPSCGSDLGGMRAELMEILGVDAAAPEPPVDDAAQLRLEFLRAELARVDAA